MKMSLSWLQCRSPRKQRATAKRSLSLALQVEQLESRLTPSVSVVNTALGNPEVFAIGLDGQVVAQVLGLDGFGSTGYFLTAPRRVKDISVTRHPFAAPEVFAIVLDHQFS